MANVSKLTVRGVQDSSFNWSSRYIDITDSISDLGGEDYIRVRAKDKDCYIGLTTVPRRSSRIKVMKGGVIKSLSITPKDIYKSIAYAKLTNISTFGQEGNGKSETTATQLKAYCNGIGIGRVGCEIEFFDSNDKVVYIGYWLPEYNIDINVTGTLSFSGYNNSYICGIDTTWIFDGAQPPYATKTTTVRISDTGSDKTIALGCVAQCRSSSATGMTRIDVNNITINGKVIPMK